jgi:hypothetical protein
LRRLSDGSEFESLLDLFYWFRWLIVTKMNAVDGHAYPPDFPEAAVRDEAIQGL